MANLGNYVLAEVMLWLMYAMLLAAMVAIGVSVVRSLRNRSTSIAASHRVPRRQLLWAVTGLTLVLLVVSCLLGSSQPLLINGIRYMDRFWLKMTDGLIVSSAVLMAIAAAVVLYGVTGLNRRPLRGGRKQL